MENSGCERTKGQKKERRAGRVAEELSKLKLGRYPFRAGIPHYVQKKSLTLVDTTLEEDARKLRYFGKVFEDLKKAGKVDTTDPRHFDYKEIEQFFLWMKGRGLEASARRTYVNILNRYLRTFGNFIIDIMDEEGSIRLPQPEEGPIKALDVEELRAVFAAADAMGGYPGIVIRGVLATAFGTGCRPKEVLNPLLQDYDLQKERYYVRHPKGEGAWGKKEWVKIIRKDMVPRLARFLKEREQYLSALDIRSKIVYINPDTMKPLTGKAIRAYKDQVATAAGIEFALKDLRPTLTTLLVDDDYAKLKAASKQLRHGSDRTTEKFYVRINKEKAVEKDLGDSWKDSEIQ